MNHLRDDLLCQKMGLRDGQIRSLVMCKNVWWSFDYGRTAFGYGDLSREDLDRIHAFLSQEENHTKVFTAWNEHHGTEWEQTKHAIVRISYAAGLTRPHDTRLEMRMR